MLTRLAQFALLSLLLLAGIVAADEQSEDTENAEESRWRLGAALGYGVRTNPLLQSDDIPIIVDFDIAWFGDHWFFDNGDLGLTFDSIVGGGLAMLQGLLRRGFVLPVEPSQPGRADA